MLNRGARCLKWWGTEGPSDKHWHNCASREVTENLNTRAAIHGSQQQADQLKAQVTDQLLKPVLDSLGIGAEGPSNAEIKGLLYRYTGDLRADFDARVQEDFGSKQLENKAPPLPEKKVSWELRY